jgi:hypothetical protein
MTDICRRYICTGRDRGNKLDVCNCLLYQSVVIVVSYIPNGKLLLSQIMLCRRAHCSEDALQL